MQKNKIRMKKTILLVVLSVFATAYMMQLKAQNQGIKLEYYTTITDASTGDSLDNTSISWQVFVYEKGFLGKKLVWDEFGSNDTDSKGALTVKIGNASGTSHVSQIKSFKHIPFGMNKYVIKVVFQNDNIKPNKLPTIKMNPTMYAMFAGKAKYAERADTAKIALASSTDVDGDGVDDKKDKERFSPVGAKVDKYGVAVDSDGDNVPDLMDKEPGTPQGQLVNFEGKSIIQNIGNGSGSVGGGTGNPLSPVNLQKGGDFLPVIFFDHQFELLSHTTSLIMVVYNYMKANPQAKLKVIGHTDVIGNEDYNLRLGLKRAQVVIDALVTLGIEEERLIPESRGETEPLVDLTQFSMLNFNRRVHFELAN